MTSLAAVSAPRPNLERAVRILASPALGLMAGVATALILPRGPITTGQALTVMASALLVGMLAGAVTRTRWSIIGLAVAYAIGVEVGRPEVVSPTLDIRLDSAYGIIAVALTRGFHGLLAFLPMAVGVLIGIAAARRRGRPIGTGILAATAVGLAVLVAWPASTPPVLGPDGQPIPGSLNELTTVRLGGTDQTVMIRAADPTAPVLLYLSGGPGQSDLAFARVFTDGWTQDLVVVDLDQRGNGRSYPAIDPISDMTLQRAVADVFELTDYLRERFDEERIYLMGESWGSILGVLAVQQRPDLFHAWLGSGQMVDIVETDRRIYADLVAYAGRTGDDALAAKLLEVGEPPYRDIPWANANLLAWYDYLYAAYTPSDGYIARGQAAGLDPFGALGSEYAVVDKVNVLRGLIDTFAVMYPQLYDLDFRESVPRLDVPVYILDGAAELDGRRDVMLEWFEALRAPTKSLVTFDGAAHSVAFEQADAVQRLLVETVIPTTREP